MEGVNKVYQIFKKEQFDFSEIESKYPHDLMAQLQEDAINEIHVKRELQIIEALEKCGYTFQNKHQLYEFAKRCEIHTFEDKPFYSELWYQKELICTWSDAFDFSNTNYGYNINIG